MYVDVVELQTALENDEILPYFQPLVELHTGKLSGFEVLARWQHPRHGLVLPQHFIQMAEESGLIDRLMRQVLWKAFAEAHILPAPLVLAVNVSPTQLRDLGLPNHIREVAEMAEFPLDRLTVEITESALVADLDSAQAIALALKKLGCRLALDDFGTGYSSLNHLQALPFDELKIDRSFVNSMTNTRESRKIVAAIVGLGHSLGLTTVGEGVETEEQADMLLWLGCERGQGWLYGRPVPSEQLAELVAAPVRVIPTALSTPGDGWAVSSLEALPTQRLAQLQAIYDGAPVGLCFLDNNLRYVSLNQKLAEMNGSSVAFHLGKTVMEMYPEWTALYQPYLDRALLGEPITGVEIPRPPLLPGGQDQVSMASFQPAWDEGDEVIGVSIAVVDITELKRTEEALRESDDHQRHLSGISHQVPWIMDAKGNSVQVSSLWVPHDKLSKARMRNLGWLEALHVDDLALTMRTMKDALRTGKPIDISYRIKDIEGTWKWMRSQGSPRFAANGEITRWYGTVEDIDEQKKRQEMQVM